MTDSTRSLTRTVLALGAAGVVIALLLIAVAAHSKQVAPAPGAAGRPAVGLRALLNSGDGQAYAAIARDPTLARPLRLASKPEFAYRAQRPLFGELAWAASLGQSDAVPLTLAILSALAAGFAVAMLALLLVRFAMPPAIALGLFAVPTVIGILWGMTPELLELALVTAGVLAWTARRRLLVLAIVALTLAALTRESMLLVPVTLGLLELRRNRWSAVRRDVAALLIPFAAYGAWVVFVRVRVGFTPFAARSNRLTLRPFAGLLHSVQHATNRDTALLWVGVGLLVVIAALVWGRRDEWYALVVAFLVLTPFLGSDVWRRPADFGRVLLPLFVYSAVLVLDALWRRSHRVAISP